MNTSLKKTRKSTLNGNICEPIQTTAFAVDVS